MKRMTNCIICNTNHEQKTVEHIVPRSLGNIHYILPKGLVCNTCNNRFSQYEHAVVNSEEWWIRRRNLGLIRKTNTAFSRPAKGFELRRFLLKIFF